VRGFPKMSKRSLAAFVSVLAQLCFTIRFALTIWLMRLSVLDVSPQCCPRTAFLELFCFQLRDSSVAARLPSSLAFSAQRERLHSATVLQIPFEVSKRCDLIIRIDLCCAYVHLQFSS
jgi:hypothetical protein